MYDSCVDPDRSPWNPDATFCVHSKQGVFKEGPPTGGGACCTHEGWCRPCCKHEFNRRQGQTAQDARATCTVQCPQAPRHQGNKQVPGCRGPARGGHLSPTRPRAPGLKGPETLHISLNMIWGLAIGAYTLPFYLLGTVRIKGKYFLNFTINNLKIIIKIFGISGIYGIFIILVKFFDKIGR